MNHLIFKNAGVSHNSICSDFKDISTKTWNLLGNAYNNNFSIGEETITDINLLELKIRQPNLLYEYKFSRREEGCNGADWAWIIVGKTGKTFMLFVQAKKLFNGSMRYENLIHTKNPTEQIDKLILNKFYFQIGLPIYPIYVFYNYFSSVDYITPCNCSQMLPMQLAGCSYADAFSIRNEIIKGNNSFKDLKKYQYAWSCLLCCNENGGKSNPDDDLADYFFKKIINSEEFHKTQLLNNEKEIPLTTESLLLREPPSFVKDIIKGIELHENPFQKLNLQTIVVLKQSEK